MSVLGTGAAARGRGFTMVEMLVVITIIVILAGMLLPVVGRARVEGHNTACINNLHQIGASLFIYAQHYGNGDVTSFPPWLTLLTTLGGREKYIHPDSLKCPLDVTQGAEGGRPDRMHYQGQSGNIDQFEMADIDEHAGVLDGSSGKKNASNGGINCSYIFEYSGEPCDWIYTNGPPVTKGTSGGVPNQNEWQWSSAPTWAEFVSKADANEDGVLSWNEAKVLSRKGWDQRGLPAWGIRVPMVRCYWHVEGQRILRNDSLVMDLLGDGGSAVRSKPPWYKD